VPVSKINGIQVYYESLGEGPPLLLIEGIPGTVPDWYPFARLLAREFKVVLFDNRGSGRSDKPQEWYTISLMASDAAALLDSLGIPRANVFGVSMGGMIAQELAINFPEKVERLVLGCTHCGGQKVIRPAPKIDEAFALETEDWAVRIRKLAPFAFSDGFGNDQPEAVAEFIAKKSLDVQPYFAYRRQIGAVIRHDSRQRLSKITSPTLVLTGTADAVIPAQNSRVLHEKIPNSEIAMIEGAGHLFFIEQPEQTLRILRSFLIRQ
jgi:pimeloyl-ACP methyl ester carboxylesterase